MKTIVNTILAAILVITTATFAHAENNKLNRLAASGTLEQYIETVTKGNVDDINGLFSESFRQKTNSNEKMITHNREQLVNFLKGEKNVKQNCETSYTVIEENANCAFAKVEMKYEKFTKVDYVSLGREGSEWKVNDVVTSYNYQ